MLVDKLLMFTGFKAGVPIPDVSSLKVKNEVKNSQVLSS